MEAIVLILALTIVVLLLNLKSNVMSKLSSLQERLDKLSEELRKSQGGVAPRATTATPVVTQTAEIKPPIIATPSIPAVEKTAMPIPEREAPVPSRKPVEVYSSGAVISSPEASKPSVIKPVKPRKPGFFERNPDMEKFIGENLANKIGIAILVLGIGFFVKYAIDKEWINEIGRVFIGIACGGILLGVAHRMRKSFAAFSSVLVGGGIAVLYFTIFIAFDTYHIFGQTAAFLLMTIITGFTIVLSLGYNRMELAILAILGGFASPLLVSTGEGNYIVLFTYILILDVGMLVLAYYKKWNAVTLVAFVFTLILFGSWLAVGFDPANDGRIAGAIIFATLFYLVFFAMNLVYNIKTQAQFKAIEISMLLSNTFCYYAAGMVILNNVHGESFKGLFTAILGVFNFVFAYSLYRNVRIDRTLVYLLIGLVLTFISLAAPVQLEGNYITLFWAAETVLLLWLSQKSGIRLMKLASLAIMGLMVVSLVMDWEIIYGNSDASLRIIFNKGYITSLVSLASIAATFYLLKNEKGEYQAYIMPYRILLTLGGVVLLYTSQLLELQHHVYQFTDHYGTQSVIIGSYIIGFILMLVLVEKKLTIPVVVREAFSFWGVVAIALYFMFYHHAIIESRNDYLTGDVGATGFVFHYILIGLLLVVSAVTLSRIRKLTVFNEKTYNLYSWFYVFFFVFVASAELDHAVLLIAYGPDSSMSHILTQNHKIGFPILWGLASFILIAVGLKKKIKHLRIISLSLLLITLLKLFLIDIRGISEGGKIAAFISLGILLLTVSFMYQRLKRLLLADEPGTAADEKETTT